MTSPTTVPQSVKDDLCERRVYLDGRPARIVGRLEQFATVRTDDRPFTSAQFAWTTAKRICLDGGGGYFAS